MFSRGWDNVYDIQSLLNGSFNSVFGHITSCSQEQVDEVVKIKLSLWKLEGVSLLQTVKKKILY